MMIHINKNIKWLRTAGITILSLILLGSCVKDELYNTPHPDKGAVTVTTDWSYISEDAVRPESYLLRIGETLQSVSAAQNTFKELLPQGSYPLLIHNKPHGITVGTQTATVNTLENGTLDPMPDYLFSAMQQLTVQKDDTLRVGANMMQAGRKLTLVLKLKAGDAERIVSSAATLSGIAHTVDLGTGKPTSNQTAGTVVPTFVKTTVAPLRTADLNALTATLHLVGVVADDGPLFKIVVTLTDGSTVTMENNLTEALKHFGSGSAPLTLDAELSIPDDKVEGSFGGTISEWTEVDNGNITIH